MALTYQQAKLVRDTVPALREHGERISSIFYKTMLRDNPELHNYFNTVNQKNGRQPRALTTVILAFASNINHISELIPKLERMCNKHCSLGIKPEQYEIVGRYLMQAFAEVLGAAWTPNVAAAWDKAYWVLAKMLIGREAQLYKEFGPGWTGWRKFKIDRIAPETDDIISFYLVPRDGRLPLPKFLPGQYVSVQVQVPEEGHLQSRQYSLSDAYNSGDCYRITVKRDEGAQYRNSVSTSYFHPGIVSNILINHMRVGSLLDVSHPAGEFYLDTNSSNSSVPLVLISAGVGVTPMVSIANTVLATQPARQISWVHVSRRVIPFQDHVAQLGRRYPETFRTHTFKTRPAAGTSEDHTYDCIGRMDLSKLNGEQDLFLSHSGTEYYICGPEQFMVDMGTYLRGQGVPGSRIKCELFSTGDLAFIK
ncbi:globin-like protein [Diplogelasinospora grovesii]|uniref:nitric oxide dioxygenase n=1 Tax=Diplogelasinospora grovesii TaxID=303347 RepID=A0AAN6NCP4_9PEZI|nr:globin-like protein [Diplogelasinospora grovesii]